MNEPTVTIAIPHHGGWRHLQHLLPSLAELDARGPVAQTLVVDNASTDGSRDFIRNHHPWVRILELPENRFFAGALNECARSATTPWLAFLNNDMHVEPTWLLEALAVAEEHDCVCVSSQILDWDGSATQFCGGTINLEGKGFQWTERDKDPNQERDLLFACGGAMLVKRDIFLEIGGFDSDYEMLFEDVDLGWRLNLAGYGVRYAPRSKVFHRGHASLSEVDYARKAIYYERNSLATVYKNLEGRYLDPLLPLLSQRSLDRVRALSDASPDGYATLNGIQVFWSNLDMWRLKRDNVQARRKVPDSEIPGLFTDLLTEPWGYTTEHRERVSECKPGLDDIAKTLDVCSCVNLS